MNSNSSYLSDFTVEALIRAMVPIESVMKQYKNEWNTILSKKDIASEEDCSTSSWTCPKSQEYFANVIVAIHFCIVS